MHRGIIRLSVFLGLGIAGIFEVADASWMLPQIVGTRWYYEHNLSKRLTRRSHKLDISSKLSKGVLMEMIRNLPKEGVISLTIVNENHRCFEDKNLSKLINYVREMKNKKKRSPLVPRVRICDHILATLDLTQLVPLVSFWKIEMLTLDGGFICKDCEGSGEKEGLYNLCTGGSSLKVIQTKHLPISAREQYLCAKQGYDLATGTCPGPCDLEPREEDESVCIFRYVKYKERKEPCSFREYLLELRRRLREGEAIVTEANGITRYYEYSETRVNWQGNAFFCTFIHDTRLPGEGRSQIQFYCSICRGGREWIASILSCGHGFHFQCISKWVRRRRATCVLCRKNIPADAFDCRRVMGSVRLLYNSDWNTSTFPDQVESEMREASYRGRLKLLSRVLSGLLWLFE